MSVSNRSKPAGGVFGARRAHLRLLISAYACAPHKGSEHAVGWNWVTEASRQGHQVTALVSPAHRTSIRAACDQDPALSAIEWVFPEVPVWRLQQDREPKLERTYNLLWQLQALHSARRLHAAASFDAVHHLTWGGIRAPTFLGALGIPLILGPIGGGETSPRQLRASLTAKARLTEAVRDLSNATIALNPVVRGGYQRASVIFVRTPETRAVLPRSLQSKCVIFSELTLRQTDIGQLRRCQPGALRLLCVGRLLYWKGIHIALRAFALHARHWPDSRLTIVGNGPERVRLEREASALGVGALVTFISWLPREDVRAVYERHDILLFPSLHDSGGTVVLEALARGLPVFCLDVGGPAELVTRRSGCIVSTDQRDTEQVSSALATEMETLCVEPARYEALSRGAIARAQSFILSDRLELLYSIFGQKSGGRAAATQGMRSEACLTS